MKKVYVSVAVRGLNQEETIAKHAEYRKKITDIIGEYQDISDDVRDFFEEQPKITVKEGSEPIYWLGKGLMTEMSTADLVVFCGDLTNTRGCKIEKMICELYGIPHIIIH